MGDRLLDLQYEGISSLCFECGIVGHRREDCPSLQHHAYTTGDGEMKSATETMGEMEEAPQQETKEKKEYGPWTLVTNRKKYAGNRRSIGGNDWKSKIGQRNGQGHDVRGHQQMDNYLNQTTLKGPHSQKEQRSIRTRTTAHRNNFPKTAGKGEQWRPRQNGESSKLLSSMDLDQEIEAQEAQAINGPFTIDPLPSFPKLKSIENTFLNPNSESPPIFPRRNPEEDDLQDQQDLHENELEPQSTDLQCDEMLDAAEPNGMEESAPGEKDQFQGRPIGVSDMVEHGVRSDNSTTRSPTVLNPVPDSGHRSHNRST